MQAISLILLSIIVILAPAAATARAQTVFAGLNVFTGTAFGSSSTKNGGGNPPLFGGDGVVNHVRFGEGIGVGGHIGYRFAPSWAAVISYQHVRNDVRWDATYPSLGASSAFDGSAASNAVLGNIAYKHPLSEATSVRVQAGLGVAFNGLSRVVETDKATGQFVSDVANHTEISPIAQIGAGLQHKVAAHIIVGLGASIAYAGGFRTGSTRSGNLGVTAINPYKIDTVWRAHLGVSLQYEF